MAITSKKQSSESGRRNSSSAHKEDIKKFPCKYYLGINTLSSMVENNEFSKSDFQNPNELTHYKMRRELNKKGTPEVLIV